MLRYRVIGIYFLLQGQTLIKGSMYCLTGYNTYEQCTYYCCERSFYSLSNYDYCCSSYTYNKNNGYSSNYYSEEDTWWADHVKGLNIEAELSVGVNGWGLSIRWARPAIVQLIVVITLFKIANSTFLTCLQAVPWVAVLIALGSLGTLVGLIVCCVCCIKGCTTENSRTHPIIVNPTQATPGVFMVCSATRQPADYQQGQHVYPPGYIGSSEYGDV